MICTSIDEEYLGATLPQRLLSQLTHNGTSEPACSVQTDMEHTYKRSTNVHKIACACTTK